MRAFIAIVFTLGLMLPAGAFAQDIDEPIAPPIDRPPALLVRPDENKPSEPLAVAAVDARVVITGFVAETSMLMTFANPHDRQLEGELVFPLPDGATVAGYGLDVDGEVVDAVIIERQRARQVFESEVRKGIDPGLVEWTKGNNFRTRIFPIPANGQRTIRVAYTHELDPADNGQMRYRLPLNFDGKVGEFSFTAYFADEDRTATLESGPIEKLDKKTTDLGDQVSAELADEKVDRDIVLTIGHEDAKTAKPVLIENDFADQRTYFIIRDSADIEALDVEPPKPTGHIGIFWDASLSRADTDKTAEFALIENYCKRMGDVLIDLFIFRDRAELRRTFDIKDGDATKLIDHLKKIDYDGGTDLANLIIPGSASDLYSADELDRISLREITYAYHLLFTDGLSNLGDGLPLRVHPQGNAVGGAPAPVFAISSATTINGPFLRELARSRGGRHLDLNAIKPAKAAAQVGRAPFALIRAEYDAKQIANITPSGSQPLDGRFTLAGRLLADEATITLHFGRGGETMNRKTYTLRKSDAIDAGDRRSTGLVGRMWAQERLDELVVFPEANRDELLDLGRDFNLVTPATSFLVLETAEQHVEHGVIPPKSRPNLLAKFNQMIEQREVQQAKTRGQHLDAVAKAWQEKVAWWEKDFKYPKDFRFTPPKGANGEDGLELLAEEGHPAPRRSPAQSAPPTLQAPDADEAPAAPQFDPQDATDSGIRGGGQGGGGLFAANEAGGEESKKEGESEGRRSTAARVQIKEWDPKKPYVKALKNAGEKGAYREYISQRKSYAKSPAFYFDCAAYFKSIERHDLARRVLTNILELKIESAQMTRIVAHALAGMEDYATAQVLFEKVLVLRPEDPQSKRDLALVLAPQKEYDRAINLLHVMICEPMDGRFEGMELIALMEMNDLLAILKRENRQPSLEEPIDPRLIKHLPSDVRILLSWDTDLTDIDLWVIEPSGEKCDYSHNRTTIGGYMSRDVTQGYGPEEYFLRKAMPGDYTIKAHFYGSQLQRVSGATTVKATVITNFGRIGETRKEMTLRLEKPDHHYEIAKIAIGSDDAKKK